MKKKSLIIIIIVVVIIIIAAATWYYLTKIKNKNVQSVTTIKPTIVAPPSQVAPVSTNIPGSEQPASETSPMGWNIYANTDGVLTLWVSTADTYQQYNNGDYIGVCDGTANLGGVQFYTFANKQIAVAQDLVNLKNEDNT